MKGSIEIKAASSQADEQIAALLNEDMKTLIPNPSPQGEGSQKSYSLSLGRGLG